MFFNSCQDLKKLAREFERRRAQTGGGPPPEQPEYFEAVKDVLGEDYATAHGINGKISLAVCCTSHNCLQVRVRTGYGILEKLWNFEKEIPYMEKLWNLSKTAVPMEKLWNFRFGGKKCVLSLEKWGENTSGLRNLVLMFVASVIISLGLVLRTSRAIPLAYCSVE